MNRNLKSNKGVTLTILVVTVIILLMISASIIHTVVDNLSAKGVNDMYTDIRALEDKINVYYAKYGDIPKAAKVTTAIPDAIKSINPNDGEDYYYIDLEKIDGLSLKYGTGDSTDKYIINETSHTIYYLEGIESEGTLYYTIHRTYTEINE